MLSSSFSLLPLALLAALAEAGTDHVVTVGKGSQLLFDPATLTAAVGDTVTYQFFAKNHAVVQSSFTDPCHPLDGGFFSGFTPTASPDVASATTFTITINDTSKPIWVYCPQTNGNHCQKGMVQAINAKSEGTNTFDLFKQAAASAGTSTTPASPNPVGGKRLTKVVVGANAELKFAPNNITELPGTVVQFSFNPKNHSVVQSSFEDPCHPLSNGFSSGFVPTANTPSGATFEVTVPGDGKPVWYYCAQTTGDHCQKGMVGAINAPASGDKTIESFAALAAKAPPSTIPPQAPIGGVFAFNGQVVSSFNGAVFTGSGDSSSGGTSPPLSNIPPPGENTTSDTWGRAGGSQPNNYNWGSTISDNATDFLHLIEWLDNILVEVLYEGYGKLNGGSWSNVYPKAIVDTIGAMAAQALVHRSTSTDSLAHYQKPILAKCQYNLPTGSVDDFLHAVLTLLLLEIGVLIDISALVAVADPWLVPALTTQVGAKARMTAVVNMMQNHLAASAVRETMIPAELAYSYAWNNYVTSCPDKLSGMPEKPYPPLKITSQTKDASGKRVTKVIVQLDATTNQGNHWIAWIGPWGSHKYTQVGSDGSADVPGDMYGHVWAVLVSKDGGKLQEIPGVTVAGPSMLWVSQP